MKRITIVIAFFLLCVLAYAQNKVSSASADQITATVSAAGTTFVPGPLGRLFVGTPDGWYFLSTDGSVLNRLRQGVTATEVSNDQLPGGLKLPTSKELLAFDQQGLAFLGAEDHTQARSGKLAVTVFAKNGDTLTPILKPDQALFTENGIPYSFYRAVRVDSMQGMTTLMGYVAAPGALNSQLRILLWKGGAWKSLFNPVGSGFTGTNESSCPTGGFYYLQITAKGDTLPSVWRIGQDGSMTRVKAPAQLVTSPDSMDSIQCTQGGLGFTAFDSSNRFVFSFLPNGSDQEQTVFAATAVSGIALAPSMVRFTDDGSAVYVTDTAGNLFKLPKGGAGTLLKATSDQPTGQPGALEYASAETAPLLYGVSAGNNIAPDFVTEPPPPPTLPTISTNGVLNGASFVPGSAPGALMSVFGKNLAKTTETGSTSSGALPKVLGGSQVLVNGNAAPLYYASPDQMNFQLPPDTPVGTANVQVVSGSLVSGASSVKVDSMAPGFFQAAGGYAITFDSVTYRLLGSPGYPNAQPGQSITTYLNGLGRTTCGQLLAGVPAPTDPLCRVFTTSALKFIVNGQEAVVTFLGLAPGYVGIYQANLVVPGSFIPPGVATQTKVVQMTLSVDGTLGPSTNVMLATQSQ